MNKKLCIEVGKWNKSIDLGINFRENKINLLSAVISALIRAKLAVNSLCRKETNLLTAVVVIKFMMGNFGNEISEIAIELQTAKNLRISQRITSLSHVIQCLQRGTLINWNISVLVYLQIAQSELQGSRKLTTCFRLCNKQPDLQAGLWQRSVHFCIFAIEIRIEMSF